MLGTSGVANVRDDLGALAESAGLRLTEAVPMPANNFMLEFTRRS